MQYLKFCPVNVPQTKAAYEPEHITSMPDSSDYPGLVTAQLQLNSSIGWQHMSTGHFNAGVKTNGRTTAGLEWECLTFVLLTCPSIISHYENKIQRLTLPLRQLKNHSRRNGSYIY